jgi:hypothetical protein
VLSKEHISTSTREQVQLAIQTAESDKLLVKVCEDFGRLGEAGGIHSDEVLKIAKAYAHGARGSETSEVCCAACDVLGVMGKQIEQHADDVAALLKNHNTLVAESIYKTLGNMGQTGAEAAAKLLKDEDKRTRKAACEALDEMVEAGQKHAGSIAEPLKDGEHDIRKTACQTLCEMGEAGQNHAGAVEKLLNSSNASRVAACKMKPSVRWKRWGEHFPVRWLSFSHTKRTRVE